MTSVMSAWDHVQLARHAARPKTLDYIRGLCEDFVELHGDRRFGDDAAIVGGPAKFNGQTVMVIGHQKGKDTRENLKRHFGMPHPEGYRKALRLFQHAERFGFPILCLIDTPGANPSKESEERGQANAIAENILVLAALRTPVVGVVIGEGGSGGALAIGVVDTLLMLEHSVYSVASPEACASILWRDSGRAAEAASALKITAHDLHQLGIADRVIDEPEGGAHTDPNVAIKAVGVEVQAAFDRLNRMPTPLLLEQRYAKYRAMGRFLETRTAHAL